MAAIRRHRACRVITLRNHTATIRGATGNADTRLEVEAPPGIRALSAPGPEVDARFGLKAIACPHDRRGRCARANVKRIDKATEGHPLPLRQAQARAHPGRRVIE